MNSLLSGILCAIAAKRAASFTQARDHVILRQKIRKVSDEGVELKINARNLAKDPGVY
jgi:hypothetical protein